MNIEENSVEIILDELNDGLYFVDENRVISYWNKAAERISGYSAEEVLGKSCADNILVHVDELGQSLCKSLCPLAAAMQDDVPREASVYLHHKDGHRVPVAVRVSALKNEKQEIIGGIELFTDISSYKANEMRLEELEKLALLDNLTQMANRHYLEQELESRFQEFSRYGMPFGLLMIDIDHFKKVNDTYGHDVGDDVLRCVGKTLTGSGRPFDLYGRWGGEEFIGIVKNVDLQQLGIIANRLLKLVANSYVMVNEEQLSVTVSIGAALVGRGDEKEGLLKRADELLYKSKDNGRNQAHVED